MRILKYVFFLLLLSFITLMIFVATQKGEFIIEKSKVINSPRSDVFNYVNDSKNWEDWSSLLLNDSGIIVIHSQNTIGKGSSYSWNGKEGSGEVQTISVKEKESIIQKMNYNGSNSDVSMSFKDTLGGTKVSWKAKGQMNFGYKIMTIYKGAATNYIGSMFEKSLDILDKKLDYELKTFTVKLNGLSKIPSNFYLAQTFTSEISKVEKNSEIVFKKILAYYKKNNLSTNGKPFIIFRSFNKENGLAKIAIGIPLKNQILINDGSGLRLGKFESIQAVKTTLTGDFTHKEEAIAKTLEFISTNKLVVDSTFSRLEIYRSGKTEIKNPSKWVTEIYIPIKSKPIEIVIINTPLDSNSIKKETAIASPKKEKANLITKKETSIVSPKKETFITSSKKEKVNLIPKKEKVISTPKKENEIPSEF